MPPTSHPLWIASTALIVTAAPLGLSLAPRDGAPVLVVGPGAAARVLEADGMIVDASGLGLIARSTSPGFAARLWAAGAWIVLDASGHTACTPSTTQPR